MNFDYQYQSRSELAEASDGATLGLATNVLREATYFRGLLIDPLLAREGFAALFAVVQSDFKWRPKERVAYQMWLESQDQEFLRNVSVHQGQAKKQLLDLKTRLAELDQARLTRRKHFHSARARYVQFAARSESEAYRVLDPVITVHPDEMSFEAFSIDQSSYARLRLGYELFANIDEYCCGTTNIDFSFALHDHLERLRSYRPTQFVLGAQGLGSKLQDTQGDAALAGNSVHEKRISLPDGWMSGFLNVHGLMSMGLKRLQLAPIDALNIVKFLLAHKTKISPRALRFELSPGLPVRVVLEPWNVSIWCSPQSVYNGPHAESLRIWGRDRLRTLLRVLPVATHVDVYLAGTGLPSIWQLQLGPHASFCLALSGWTDNDWVGGEARFELLSRRASVLPSELDHVHEILRALRTASFEDLSQRTELALEKVKSAVSLLAQDGRAMFDLSTQKPRFRDLLTTPFSPGLALKNAKAFEHEDPRSKAAHALLENKAIHLIARRKVGEEYKLSGNSALTVGTSERVRPQLHVGPKGEIISASCTCAEMLKNGLSKGPCPHILALRMLHMEKL